MVAGTTQGPVVSTYRRAPGVARHDDRRGVAVAPLHLAAVRRHAEGRVLDPLKAPIKAKFCHLGIPRKTYF